MNKDAGVVMLISGMLQRLIQIGRLTVTDAAGRTHSFEGVEPGPEVEVRLTDRRIEWHLLLDPDMAVGEGYMDGRIILEKGDIYDLIELGTVNHALLPRGLMSRMAGRIRYFVGLLYQVNFSGRARRNVAYHYDLSSQLYELFLDPDRQYSCAYFPTADTSIDEAQLLKKRHIAAKLLLEPGQRVLDIGCGWGGLAIYLSQVVDVEVTGLTLSTEQHSYAKRRVDESGLADRVQFEVEDYRRATGTYDRVVSVGMFEHVGIHHYETFFCRLRDRLAEDGVALLHTIGVVTEPRPVAPFIREYIFPGSHTPALSELMPAIERAGLVVTDIEVLRLHYAETLDAWRRRFLANWEKAEKLYDKRFCRMWEFYLAACEIFFRYCGGVVFQLQLAKHQDVVPLTRDYIWAAEKQLAMAEPRRYKIVA
jgi:cyclopropane-fatty-acyl-phospholipid synthase